MLSPTDLAPTSQVVAKYPEGRRRLLSNSRATILTGRCHPFFYRQLVSFGYGSGHLSVAKPQLCKDAEGSAFDGLSRHTKALMRAARHCGDLRCRRLGFCDDQVCQRFDAPNDLLRI